MPKVQKIANSGHTAAYLKVSRDDGNDNDDDYYEGNQCDQMAVLFIQYLAFDTNKICPKV